MSLRDVLHWRYAPKRMNGAIVPEEKIHAILTAAQFAPSSMGLQPFQLFLVSNKSLKEQIKPIAYQQPQIAESSHLLIYTAYTSLSTTHVHTYLQNIIHTRGVEKQTLDAFERSMLGFANTRGEQEIIQWATNQAYLSIGFALAEAALQNVDATPMEGFNAAQLDALLELPQKQLTSVAIIALGYRDSENDFLATSKKVRKPLSDLVIRID